MPGLLRAVNHLLNWNARSLSQPGEKVYFYYHQIVEQARNPFFYEDLNVPDTLEGRFDCISLHMVLLLMVLKEENNQEFSQYLFDLFFADVDRNLREIGVGDLSVGRQVKKLASNFYGVLQVYEDGLSQDTVLSQALATNLYGATKPSETQLKTLINYMRESIRILSKIHFDQENIKIVWPELR